jgi:hypothetical protein
VTKRESDQKELVFERSLKPNQTKTTKEQK